MWNLDDAVSWGLHRDCRCSKDSDCQKEIAPQGQEANATGHLLLTGNHYKWDWPKSQFSMPNDSATVVWLRNLKVGNVYLFNFPQNALKKLSFSKWEIRNLENVIFPSSAEPCRILQNSALTPQNSAEHFGENHEILRISAEFCGIPQNGFSSTELFCGTTKRNNILQKSAELSQSVLWNSAGVFGSAEPFCGTIVSSIHSAEFCRTNQRGSAE